MRQSRSSRVVAALIALFSILFMQLAVAAYACPGLSMGQGAPMPEMTAHSADAGMTPCSEMDMEQPSLCHASEHAGYQSLDKPQLPHVAQFVPAPLVAVWHTYRPDVAADHRMAAIGFARTKYRSPRHYPQLLFPNLAFQIA